MTLLAHYPLDGSPQDVAGTNDGTWVGTATPAYTTGVNGTQAAQTTGNGGASINVGGLRVDGSFTLAVWWRQDDRTTPSGNARDHQVFFNRNSEVQFGVRDNDSNGDLEYHASIAESSRGWVFNDDISANAPADGAWHHAALVYDASGGMTIYEDGTQVYHDATWNGPIPYNGGADDTYIGGKSTNWDSEWFKGGLDDVRLYDRPMTAAEVRRLYQSSSSGVLVASRKTAPEPIRPTLSTTHASNGETIRVHVIGSPGQASEERREVVLPATNATDLPLNWQAAHTDFRVEMALASATPTATPTVNEVTLTE